MIKNLNTAEKFNRALLQAGAELNNMLLEIWSELPEDEQTRCRLAIGNILGEILSEGLNPIHRVHPTLVPPDMRSTSGEEARE